MTPKHTELTEAHKGDQHTNLVGRPRGLGFGPANGVGGPMQALRRLPGLGSDGKSGPARVAAAATPHGGSVAHNAAQHARASSGTQRNLPAHESTQHTL